MYRNEKSDETVQKFPRVSCSICCAPSKRGWKSTLNGIGWELSVSVNANVSIGKPGTEDIRRAHIKVAALMVTDRCAKNCPGQTLKWNKNHSMSACIPNIPEPTRTVCQIRRRKCEGLREGRLSLSASARGGMTRDRGTLQDLGGLTNGFRGYLNLWGSGSRCKRHLRSCDGKTLDKAVELGLAMSQGPVELTSCAHRTPAVRFENKGTCIG